MPARLLLRGAARQPYVAHPATACSTACNVQPHIVDTGRLRDPLCALVLQSARRPVLALCVPLVPGKHTNPNLNPNPDSNPNPNPNPNSNQVSTTTASSAAISVRDCLCTKVSKAVSE